MKHDESDLMSDLAAALVALYGRLKADADAGTQPLVQTGSPELLKVIDPSCTAEQNA